MRISDWSSDVCSSDLDVHENDLADYCAALGYPRPHEIIKQSEDYGVGNTILNTATDDDSDLIIMGAYGHSRMRQWIMGGASRTLLNSMTVPVLMSHRSEERRVGKECVRPCRTS